MKNTIQDISKQWEKQRVWDMDLTFDNIPEYAGAITREYFRPLLHPALTAKEIADGVNSVREVVKWITKELLEKVSK